MCVPPPFASMYNVAAQYTVNINYRAVSLFSNAVDHLLRLTPASIIVESS